MPRPEISLSLRGKTTKPEIRYVLFVSNGARFMVVTWDIFFQVFINYGPLPNNRLLRLYGFVLSSNPNDSYDIVLSTYPTAPFWEQKQKLWISAGLDSTCTISLTLTDPLPKSILRYLRI